MRWDSKREGADRPDRGGGVLLGVADCLIHDLKRGSDSLLNLSLWVDEYYRKVQQYSGRSTRAQHATRDDFVFRRHTCIDTQETPETDAWAQADDFDVIRWIPLQHECASLRTKCHLHEPAKGETDKGSIFVKSKKGLGV